MIDETYSVYRLEDGLFVGQLTADEEHARLNTQPGHALMLGKYDPNTQRMNVATGEVETFVPSPPSDDETKRQARQAALLEIYQLEAKQLRPQRELSLNPESTGARDRLQTIESRIIELRQVLNS